MRFFGQGGGDRKIIAPPVELGVRHGREEPTDFGVEVVAFVSIH